MVAPSTGRRSSHWLLDADSSRKISADIPRVVPFEETVARANSLKHALPVTRLADLTPLDAVGLPVFCAVTPMARDLTTHMGKGGSEAAARVSALMEACERVSAETVHGTSLRASMDEMLASGRNLIDPRDCALPPDSAFDPGRPITWIEGRDVSTGNAVWGAADLVLNPPAEDVISQPDTNGLASGNTLLEAVVHGLGEVIERDAAGRLLFAELYSETGDPAPLSRRIDPASLPDDAISMVDRMTRGGLRLVIDDIADDIVVPTIRATLIDPAYPTPNGPDLRRFTGMGCDPHAGIALSRALTEAAQSRLAIIQGARDSFNRLPVAQSEVARRRRLADLQPAPMAPFSDLPNRPSQDLADDLNVLLDALAAAGIGQVAVFDLTRPDIGLPVVRVSAPGLSRFFVDRSRVSERDLSCLI